LSSLRLSEELQGQAQINSDSTLASSNCLLSVRQIEDLGPVVAQIVKKMVDKNKNKMIIRKN
jgi:hypothetical protein